MRIAKFFLISILSSLTICAIIYFLLINIELDKNNKFKTEFLLSLNINFLYDYLYFNEFVGLNNMLKASEGTIDFTNPPFGTNEKYNEFGLGFPDKLFMVGDHIKLNGTSAIDYFLRTYSDQLDINEIKINKYLKVNNNVDFKIDVVKNKSNFIFSLIAYTKKDREDAISYLKQQHFNFINSILISILDINSNYIISYLSPAFKDGVCEVSESQCSYFNQIINLNNELNLKYKSLLKKNNILEINQISEYPLNQNIDIKSLTIILFILLTIVLFTSIIILNQYSLKLEKK